MRLLVQNAQVSRLFELALWTCYGQRLLPQSIALPHIPFKNKCDKRSLMLKAYRTY
jgi:hypothetical protein